MMNQLFSVEKLWKELVILISHAMGLIAETVVPSGHITCRSPTGKVRTRRSVEHWTRALTALG